MTHIYQPLLVRENGPAGIRSVAKSVPNRLQITPHNVFFRTIRPTDKDRQRYALYLTVFWFPSMCTSEKTVKNTVKLSSYLRVKTLDALQILFLAQYVMRLEAGTADVFSIVPGA
jgi:hypothetical protein